MFQSVRQATLNLTHCLSCFHPTSAGLSFRFASWKAFRTAAGLVPARGNRDVTLVIHPAIDRQPLQPA
jgi:hypothetical protein